MLCGVGGFGLAGELLSMDLQKDVFCYGRLCMPSSAVRGQHAVYWWDAALAYVHSLCGFYLPPRTKGAVYLRVLLWKRVLSVCHWRSHKNSKEVCSTPPIFDGKDSRAVGPFFKRERNGASDVTELPAIIATQWIAGQANACAWPPLKCSVPPAMLKASGSILVRNIHL